MAKADRLRTTFQKTAKKLEENVAKSVKRASRGRSPGVPAHKHCKVCRISIHANSDPPLCGEEACQTQHERDLKQRKQLRIWMIVFIVAFILPLGRNAFQALTA